jgi:hypothetical protein
MLLLSARKHVTRAQPQANLSNRFINITFTPADHSPSWELLCPSECGAKGDGCDALLALLMKAAAAAASCAATRCRACCRH